MTSSTSSSTAKAARISAAVILCKPPDAPPGLLPGRVCRALVAHPYCPGVSPLGLLVEAEVAGLPVEASWQAVTRHQQPLRRQAPAAVGAAAVRLLAGTGSSSSPASPEPGVVLAQVPLPIGVGEA